MSDSGDPRDGSPPGSPVPGILQARTLEWVAISFSNAWKWKVKGKSLIVSDSQQPHGLQPTRLLCPRDLPGKSTGVGCHCLLLIGKIERNNFFSPIRLKLIVLLRLLRIYSYYRLIFKLINQSLRTHIVQLQREVCIVEAAHIWLR